MKKVILSLAILASSGLSLMAQSNNSSAGNPQCENPQQCEVSKCKEEKKCDKKCLEKKDGEKKSPKKMSVRPGMSFESMFAGLDLTQEQKAKLSALRETSYKNNIVREKNADSKEELTPEQKRLMRMESATQQKDARVNMLKQVKEILTPDQYVTFLENFFTQQDDNFNGNSMNKINDKRMEHKGMHRMKDPRGIKESKKGDKSKKND